MKVLDAIHSLLSPDPSQKLLSRKVEEIFIQMDLNKDGVITEDEFFQYCRSNQQMLITIEGLA